MAQTHTTMPQIHPPETEPVAPRHKRRITTPHLKAPRVSLPPVRMRVRVHTLDSLHHRNFRLLWLSTLGLSAGAWTVEVVVGWLTYDLTRSPLLTSLALSLGALPFLLASPAAGLLVDTWDRRKVLTIAMAYHVSLIAVLAALVALGRAQTWHIFAVILATGLSGVTMQAAYSALIPNLVPRHSMVNAFALNAVAANVTRLVVPALAGVSIALLGAGETLLVAVALLLGALWTAHTIGTDRPGQPARGRKPSFGQIAEAARYIRGEPLIPALLLMAVVPIVLVLPYVQGLMPVYASEVFGAGPAGLGLLVSALGAGATLGVLVIASMGEIERKGRVLILALAMMIVAALSFALTPSLAVALPVLMLLSASLSVYFTVAGAMIQAVAPDDLRGRVASLSAMPLGLYPLGALVSGSLAVALGAPTATAIAAMTMALLLAGLLARSRYLWAFK